MGKKSDLIKELKEIGIKDLSNKLTIAELEKIKENYLKEKTKVVDTDIEKVHETSILAISSICSKAAASIPTEEEKEEILTEEDIEGEETEETVEDIIKGIKDIAAQNGKDYEEGYLEKLNMEELIQELYKELYKEVDKNLENKKKLDIHKEVRNPSKKTYINNSPIVISVQGIQGNVDLIGPGKTVKMEYNPSPNHFIEVD